MKTALAIRHVAFEDLGSFAPLLREYGYAIRYAEAADGLAAVDAMAPDLVILCGGPIGVYEDEAYPFIRDEIRLTEKRLAAERPTLGLCLGSQMMARALGARVFPGAAGKEIGWTPLTLTDAGHQSCVAHLAPDLTEVLHWHGDTFDLPLGAVRLASTRAYENQAFVYGKAALALQFHPEVTARGLEHWYVGHAGEIAATPGISVPQLRADATRCAAKLEMQAASFLRAWLAQAGDAIAQPARDATASRSR